MEALAYLARSDSSDDDDVDSSDGRPTPLDPEYWRGITHSREVVAAPAAAYRPPGRHEHHYDPYGYPAYHTQPYQRPATSPSAVMHGHYGPAAGGGVLMSPIHYQAGPPMVPISPVAHMNAANYMPPHAAVGMAHATGVGLHRPAEWSSPPTRSYSATAISPVSTPQQLKQQVREAFVRAQTYLDLGPFFMSYDMSYSGGIRLGSIQEALSRMGVILGDPVLQICLCGPTCRDDMRSMVAARRSVLANSGIELGEVFVQYDAHRTGFVSRATFATILRDYSVHMPDTTLHFLMIQLANPSDTTSVSYVRFLEMTDVGVARAHSMENLPARFGSWPRSNLFDRESPPHRYDRQAVVPVVTQVPRVVDYAAASPEFATPLPRLGWVCRVCAHQQIADWATHCEICETSKPRPGLRGEGYIKCSHCKFDNNFDMEKCEMCGRPLNPSNKKVSKAEKKRRSIKRYVSSSSSDSSSTSSSSSSSSGHRRTSRRKSEKHSQSSHSGRRKEEKKRRFQRGEEIQAIPLGGRGYEIGVIARVRSNGTYDVEFDSGLFEKNVEGSCILEISRARVIKAKDLSDGEETKSKPKAKDSDNEQDPRYESGDRVEARFQGRERYFAGKIKKCRTDGSYDIEYDDGEMELRVRPKYIKREEAKKREESKKQSPPPPTQSDVSSSEATWTKGQKVEAKIRGYQDYVKCIVFRVNADGSCDLELESGDLSKRVPGYDIRADTSAKVKPRPAVQSDDEPIRPRRPLAKTPSAPSTSDDSSAQPKHKFKQGQQVEAKRKEKDGYYPGVVARCRLNGSYDINFDDGEKVLAVPALNVRGVESAPTAKKAKASSTRA
ncbi:unnamed protein product [Phytophthora fragariaefolia]|uniref:Unnamed protein product n=1 Tax=Phytophthora fragariaefolia TaxID=1490495 RepID=A0A9W7D3V2_9STRA|nr:unnamed protein product [Phytophthora fragariaefolia]